MDYINLIISIISLLIAIIAIYLIWSLKKSERLKQLELKDTFEKLHETEPKEILLANAKELIKQKNDIKEIYQMMDALDNRLAANIAKLSIKRYNPFEDTGSDQSFSLIFLDEKNNGLIFSSLHARNQTRTYAKKISAGKSEHALTEEETALLNEVIGK